MAETANRILLERLGAERRTDPLEAGSNLSSASAIARAWPKAWPKAQRRLINASSRVGGATYGNSLKRLRIDADDCVRVDPTHVLSWCTEKNIIENPILKGNMIRLQSVCTLFLLKKNNFRRIPKHLLIFPS